MVGAGLKPALSLYNANPTPYYYPFTTHHFKDFGLLAAPHYRSGEISSSLRRFVSGSVKARMNGASRPSIARALMAVH